MPNLKKISCQTRKLAIAMLLFLFILSLDGMQNGFQNAQLSMPVHSGLLKDGEAQSQTGFLQSDEALLNTEDVFVWNGSYGGSQNDHGFAIVNCSNGGYALAGETRSSGAGGSDA